jgi:hypothetical protein
MATQIANTMAKQIDILPPYFEQDLDYQFAAKFITIYEKICKYHKIDLDYRFLSGNPLVTMAYVNKHPNKPWCWQALTSNPSISLQYIDEHPEKFWNQDEYNLRKYGGEAEPIVNESYAVIDDNLFPPCSDWSASNVILDELVRYMPLIDTVTAFGYAEEEENDIGYCWWREISDNPNLTLDFIDSYYKKPWSHNILAMNPLAKAKAKYRKEYIAAYKIQQAYARAKYIPLYAYCRKLHLQFYESQYGCV